MTLVGKGNKVTTSPFPSDRMKRLGVLVFSLALASSCSAPSRPRGESSYFPMSSRRVWEYRLSRVTEDARWPVTVRSRIPTFVPELGRVAAIFDEEYPDA